MNGRTAVSTYLKDNFLSSYVRSKAVEVILSAIFTVAYHITRQLTIMVFPTVFIRICGTFAYIPALFLPWRYTLVIPILVLFTSPEPIGSFFALTAGIQVAYFGGRLLKRYRVLSLIFATLAANLVAYGVRVLMGIIPADVAFSFYMLKAMVTAVAIAVIAPPTLKIFESLKIIDFKR